MRRRVAQLMPIALRHAMSSLTEKLKQESFQTTAKLGMLAVHLIKAQKSVKNRYVTSF